MKKNVVADMAADLFHRGHVQFLTHVRHHFENDFEINLTVALHSDQQILSYKGRLPIQDYESRKAVLESCRLVDNVVHAPDIFDDAFAAKFDFLAHGDDLLSWPQEKIEQYYKPFIDQNKLVLIPYTKGISTTSLIRIAHASKP